MVGLCLAYPFQKLCGNVERVVYEKNADIRRHMVVLASSVLSKFDFADQFVALGLENR